MSDQTPERATSDRKCYARAICTGDHATASRIEKDWDLYGYPPEIVSNVLACVSTGLPLEAAIAEATS